MKTDISFELNYKKVSICVDPLKRLIDVLRDDFCCIGVKEGCSEGECGACSILLNEKIVTSCLIPVGAVNGQRVVTIEGLKATDKGRILVDAFADAGAVQCGFCIPGMIIAAYYLLCGNPCPTDEEIRLGISGNICRCTGYDLIVEAVKLASVRGGDIWKN